MQPYPPQPQPDQSKKFMQTGIGILVIVLSLCLGAPVVFCLFSLFIGALRTAGR